MEILLSIVLLFVLIYMPITLYRINKKLAIQAISKKEKEKEYEVLEEYEC